LAGIAIAVAAVGVFGLKMASSMVGGADHIDGVDPLPAAPRAFEQPPDASPGVAPPAPPFAEPTAQAAPADTTSMSPPDGVTQNPQVTQGATPAVASAAPNTNAPATAGAAAGLDVQVQIDRINKRVDEVATAVAALAETVGKLQSVRVAKADQDKSATKMGRVAEKPAGAASGSPVERKRKAAPEVEPAGQTAQESTENATANSPKRAARKPADAAQAQKVDPGPTPASAGEARVTTGDVALQAVLQDRAWFRLKSGETVTAGVGEEVPGVGVVRAIDVETGRVTFANGAVLR